MAEDLDLWDDAGDADLDLADRTQRKLHEMRLKVSKHTRQQLCLLLC